MPGVLDKLGMYSVSTPITSMVNAFLGFVPKLVAAGIIVAVGLFIANIVKDLLKSVLKAVKVDALQEKAGIEAAENASFSSIVANVVYGVIVLIVVTSAFDQLGITAISAPANAVESVIVKKFPAAKVCALVAKVAVYVLVGFLCLSQLGVATAIVETTFILIIAALSVAFAIAFGVGGRQFAANMLEKLEKKMDDNK